MERGLNVLLLLLMAQGIEDAPHLPPPQRTISHAAGTSATEVWLLICAQLLHPSGYQTGNVYTCSLHILQKSHTESMCVCLSHTYLVYVRSDMYILYNVTVYI